MKRALNVPFLTENVDEALQLGEGLPVFLPTRGHREGEPMPREWWISGADYVGGPYIE